MKTYIITEDQLRASIIALQLIIRECKDELRDCPGDSVILEDLEYFKDHLRSLNDMRENS